MKRNKKAGFAIVGVVILIILIVVTYISFYSSNYVAKVADYRIKDYEYKFYLKNAEIEMINESELDPEADEETIKAFWEGTQNGEKRTDLAKKKALAYVQDYAIAIIKAKEAGLEITDEDKQAIDLSFEQFQGNEAEVEAFYGAKIDQLKKIVQKTTLIDKYTTDFKNSKSEEIEVSDEEARELYDLETEYFQTATIRQIVLYTKEGDNLDEEISSEEKAEKEDLANNILERINNGEDMESLVTEYSEDEYTKVAGGIFEFTRYETIDADLTSWAFSADVGSTSIITTDVGIYVIRLEKISTFEDVIEKVKYLKKEIKLDEEYENQIAEWKKDSKYNIETNEKEYEKITVDY